MVGALHDQAVCERQAAMCCSGSKIKSVMELVFGPEAAVHAASAEELWYHSLVRWSLAALLHRSSHIFNYNYIR